MQRSSVILWVVAGTFILIGGAWLAELAWRATEAGEPGGVGHVPLAIGAALAGLTISRAYGRGAIGITLASSLVLAVAEAIALARHGNIEPWTSLSDAPSLLVFVAISTAAATAASAVRLPGAPDHALLWLWVSALITLGGMVSGLMFTMHEHDLSSVGLAVVVVAPVVAGGLTQMLVARRMIWVCGGGALMFVLIIADQSIRGGDTDGMVAGMCGAAMFVLLGALGARIGWRIHRGVDHDLARSPELPTATTR